MPQGLHLIAEFFDCQGSGPLLRDAAALQALCVTAVTDSGLRPVGTLFHPFEQGSDPGLTGVVLLAESHVTIHTWPEYGSVTVDAYVCNHQRDHSACAEQLMQRLIDAFRPGRVQRQSVLRSPVNASAL